MHGTKDLDPDELQKALEFYKKELIFGKWKGFRCGLGFYLFIYIDEDKQGIITGTGSAINYDLELPYTHRLVRAGVLKLTTDASTIQLQLGLPFVDKDNYFDILMNTSADLNRSNVWLADPPENYETLPNTRLRFSVNLTNTKKAVLFAVVYFLEFPN